MLKFLTKLTTLFFLILLSVNLVFSQNQDSTHIKIKAIKVKSDSTSGVRITDSTKSILQQKKLKGFVDRNANGIDDRIENGIVKGKQKGKKDKFIDKNGDGICDGRESAFGIKKAFRKRQGGKK